MSVFTLLIRSAGLIKSAGKTKIEAINIWPQSPIIVNKHKCMSNGTKMLCNYDIY